VTGVTGEADAASGAASGATAAAASSASTTTLPPASICAIGGGGGAPYAAITGPSHPASTPARIAARARSGANRDEDDEAAGDAGSSLRQKGQLASLART
jgi:hypothetical protein